MLFIVKELKGLLLVVIIQNNVENEIMMVKTVTINFLELISFGSIAFNLFHIYIIQIIV